jgi:drug/metabolite transporter (DMT)-like permease
MAIVSCPSCGKSISGRIMLCPHCGFQRGEVEEEQLKEFHRRKLRDRIYHLKMASYAALTLLIGAFGWYLAATEGFQYRSSMGPYIMFAVGSVFYLGIRVYLYKFKIALRKLSC